MVAEVGMPVGDFQTPACYSLLLLPTCQKEPAAAAPSPQAACAAAAGPCWELRVCGVGPSGAGRRAGPAEGLQGRALLLL